MIELLLICDTKSNKTRPCFDHPPRQPFQALSCRIFLSLLELITWLPDKNPSFFVVPSFCYVVNNREKCHAKSQNGIGLAVLPTKLNGRVVN